MLSVLGLLVLLSLPNALHSATISPADSTLIYVHVLFRHGDRAPTRLYKGDPLGPSVWPRGLGQLTLRGTEQTFQLGKFLRARYGRLISKEFVHSEVYARTSEYDRQSESAQWVMAGLYAGEKPWANDSMPVHPRNVHSIPYEQDNLLAVTPVNPPCRLYDKLFNEELKREHNQQAISKHFDFFRLLSANSAQSADFLSYYHIGDTIYCQAEHNMRLPAWIGDKDAAIARFESLQTLLFGMGTSSVPLRRLRIGPLLHTLLAHWRAVGELSPAAYASAADINSQDKSGVPKEKVLPGRGARATLYSTHDTEIAYLMGALGTLHRMPPYASAILLELHRVGVDANSSLRLRVFNRNESGDPVELFIPRCSPCSLDEFEQMVKPFTLRPKDWDGACQNPLEVPFSSASSPNNALPVLLLVLSLVATWWTRP